MSKNASFLLVVLLALLPARFALAAGDSEESRAQFARLNEEVQALQGRLDAGVSRAEFGQACADCHGATPKFPLLGARQGYDTSGHKNNDNSTYANGQGCQRCHTNEGFIEFARTGTVDPQAFVAYPSQPTCVTCHTQHESWDLRLRWTRPVKLVDGSEFDLGQGNLCAACHQSSTAAAAVVKVSAAKDIRSHWGAHHGPQSDLINGSNAWEFRGKQYASSPHKDVLENGCVECHMALPTGRYGLSPAIGGHSFNIAGEVHEAPVVNLVACVGCHEGIKQLRGTELFDLKAAADFDRDGAVEPAQLEVRGLLEYFANPKGTGYLQNLNPPMFKKDAAPTMEGLGAGWVGASAGQWTESQMGALFNLKLIAEDRSLGVHNLTYTLQVLYDSLQALDPRFDVSLRP